MHHVMHHVKWLAHSWCDWSPQSSIAAHLKYLAFQTEVGEARTLPFYT